MHNAILIFTFSPIQPFIAEARRTSDLYAASKILSKLAGSIGEFLEGEGELIYPAKIGPDVPNKLVLQVTWDEVDEIAQKAEDVLKQSWQKEAKTALDFFKRKNLEPFNSKHQNRWMQIWTRQINDYWEYYWAAVQLRDGNYHKAYSETSKILNAVKRTRHFKQKQEMGLKDTLSGMRSALRTEKLDGRDYWAKLAKSPAVFNARLRPEGRERLDAIGMVKRFGKIGLGSGARFPSTSSITSTWFLEAAREKRELKLYREAVSELLGEHLHKVNEDTDWPYDGDLFYKEELYPKRLQDCYGIDPDKIADNKLANAKEKLQALYEKVPVPLGRYYAILVFDGDNMGEHIARCKNKEEHQKLSSIISDFASTAKQIVEKTKYRGRLVYAGGDDVLALSPLVSALPMAQELSNVFSDMVPGATASGGIAVVHHLFPLGAAIRAAHSSERSAKDVEGKNALAVRVLKRSGETTETISKWEGIAEHFETIRIYFEKQILSSRFAYKVHQVTYGIPNPGDMFTAELKRLIRRNRQSESSSVSFDPERCANELNQWAENLPVSEASQEIEGGQTRTESLAYWLLLARFVAQPEKKYLEAREG